MSNSGLDFMSSYHSSLTVPDGSESDYSKNIKGFEEHLDYSKLLYAYQIAGYETKDTTADDEWIVKTQTRKDLKKKNAYYDRNDMKVKQAEFDNMVGTDILTPAEDMLNNRFNNFSRYGYLDPSGELVTGTREYLFFSKPDLHLVDVVNSTSDKSIYAPLKNSPFFDEAFRRYKLSYYALQQTYNTNPYSGILTTDGLSIDIRTKYIPLLTNMVSSSFDLPDVAANEVLGNQNLYQVNTSYREGSMASDLQYDFSLEFKDTKYLDVYMLFKIYDEYFKYKYMVDMMPTKMDYIFNKIYPEALSIWKLIVDDTGRIIYWAKATGCTPMSVPRGTLSNIEGNIKFTVNWKAQFIRDMDPVNLNELNYLTSRSLGYTGSGSDIMSTLSSGQHILPDVIHNTGNHNLESHTSMNQSTWVGYPMVISNYKTNPVRTGHATSDASTNGFHRLVWIK